MDLVALVADAMAQLDVDVAPADDDAADLVLDVHGAHVPVQLKRLSLVDASTATRLVAAAVPDGHALLVIGDRVTDDARRTLRAHRVGYLDLRGRLDLRTDRLALAADVAPLTAPAGRDDPLAGRAGMEVATALLMAPDRPAAVRPLARHVGRSPSTVSEVLAALRRTDLIDPDNAVRGSELFWRVADRWPTQRVHLAARPAPPQAAPLRLGLLDDDGAGWALADTAAALAYGAPVAARADHALDFFVPDPAVLRRATTLLGTAPRASDAAATARVAPVPALVRERVRVDGSAWPLAHPVFVALDLAQDVGRGREVLAGWEPTGPWQRVW